MADVEEVAVKAAVGVDRFIERAAQVATGAAS
jgi:hypothetical protein